MKKSGKPLPNWSWNINKTSRESSLGESNRGTNISMFYSNFPIVRQRNHCIFPSSNIELFHLCMWKFKFFLMVPKGILKKFLVSSFKTRKNQRAGCNINHIYHLLQYISEEFLHRRRWVMQLFIMRSLTATITHSDFQSLQHQLCEDLIHQEF